jgi:hypothetical protein
MAMRSTLPLRMCQSNTVKQGLHCRSPGYLITSINMVNRVQSEHQPSCILHRVERFSQVMLALTTAWLLGSRLRPLQGTAARP